jgi:hypothetical protein
MFVTRKKTTHCLICIKNLSSSVHKETCASRDAAPSKSEMLKHESNVVNIVDLEVLSTSGTYPWSFVTQILHNV